MLCQLKSDLTMFSKERFNGATPACDRFKKYEEIRAGFKVFASNMNLWIC